MSNGERVIVKLDPNYNPTGKPMPDTLLKKIKADPDFAKLSEEEQMQVISKVENMIQEVEDVDKYGTLKEKLMKVAALRDFYNNREAIPYVTLSSDMAYRIEKITVQEGFLIAIPIEKGIYLLREGSDVNAGQCVLKLLAANSNDETYGCYNLDYGIVIAEIKAPISGKIFSLCQMRQKEAVRVEWNDDLFIVSSIPDDTRSAAIKWYKETTGKVPKYKTSEDIQKEMATKEANVDNYLSKWDL